MHLLISVVRQLCKLRFSIIYHGDSYSYLGPDQLRPFEGLFGFNEHTTEFEGTIFRFPIMESRAKSDLYSGGLFPLAVRCDPVDRAVRDYYEDASISLLFLENIGSIASYERLSKSAGLVKLWGVSVVYRKPISIPHLTQLKMYCEGEHVYQEKPKKTKWLVLRSTISVSDTPDLIQATCRRHKLQPRCAIAAQISKIRPAHTGRLFLDLPTPTNLGIPVHISAVRNPFQLSFSGL